jgi:hypothetical protein
VRKSLIHLVSALAIVNLLAVIGAVGFLFGTGRLDADRVERIAEIILGEDEEETEEIAAEIEQPDEKEQAQVKLARAREESDLIRRMFERQERETRDRQRLVDAMMLDVTRRQEELADDRELFDEQQRNLREERLQSGFQKELELLEAAKPKVRRDLLRAKSDADAVRLMMEMDSRAGKQVVDACKSPQEKVWISRILYEIETLNEPRTASAGANEQDAQ